MCPVRFQGLGFEQLKGQRNHISLQSIPEFKYPHCIFRQNFHSSNLYPELCVKSSGTTEKNLASYSLLFLSDILCKLHNDSPDEVLEVESTHQLKNTFVLVLFLFFFSQIPLSVLASVADGRMRREPLFNGNSFIILHVSYSGK